METTFATIYRTNAWGNFESRSGPGSTVARCQVVIEAILRLIAELRVHTLLDAPCGDFNWMSRLSLGNVRYWGVDVVPELIEANRRCHGAPGREFQYADITAGPLPRADLILCRDCLVHLPSAEVVQALAVFRKSGSRYLAATSFPAWPTQPEIALGAWRPLNLQAAPFHLPPPCMLLSDGCTAPGYTDKALGVWRLDAGFDAVLAKFVVPPSGGRAG